MDMILRYEPIALRGLGKYKEGDFIVVVAVMIRSIHQVLDPV